jgi:hypothetical protein
MMKYTSVLSALLVASGITIAATAVNPSVAITLCTDSGYNAGGSTYTSCSGPISGNNRGSQNSNLLNTLNNGQLTDLTQLGGSLDFTQYDWQDSTTALNLQPQSNGTSGNWSITTAIDSPFAIAVKGGPTYSVYFFNGLTNITGGFWDTLGINKGNGTRGPDLSHMDIYTTTSTPVPEPITMLGLGVGTVGMGMLKRKYGNKEAKAKVVV